MPMLIDPIDKIAREKGRDVLFIRFYQHRSMDMNLSPNFDWRNCIARNEMVKWLEANHIQWQPCFIVWRDGLVAYPYLGDIYVDVPFDTTREDYQRLAAHLENSDGSMRLPDVTFYCLQLAIAMKNAHHDAPDYGDNW